MSLLRQTPKSILPALQSEPDLSETWETEASGSLSGGALGLPARSHNTAGAVDSAWDGGHHCREGVC